MKKTLKTMLTILVLSILLILTNSIEVQAALQANQNTQYTTKESATNWMTYFRQMETAGGAMGLNETLNSDLTASSDSNNIDVHMMRTTEYGAIAILSASGYGNPSNDRAITSTTGNNTGIMLNTSYWEWTAGGVSGYICSGIDSRYYDTYTSGDNTSARVGDALGTSSTTNPGATKWHSASYSNWVSSAYPWLVRGYEGIFSYRYHREYDGGYYCRGVAVCGEGL